MLTLEEALAALQQLPLQGEVEHRSLDQALGQVLAQDVHAQADQPPFDRTTMDGFAVVLQGDQNEFEVVGSVLAGEQFSGTLQPGQAVRIMTGAPCPAGATVVPVEQTSGYELQATEGSGVGRVTIQPEALIPRKNVAWRGQDAQAGECILRAGVRIAPQTISSAAMAGADSLAVYAPPRVGIITTGDEIGASGPASVRNSNGPLLGAFCAALGVPYRAWHAVDEPESLRSTFEAAAEASDILVSVGGVSMGTADLVPGTTQALGFQKILHRVAIQPGKPVYLAQHGDGTCFLGLPGNPVSVLVTAHLFLAPLIGRFCGNWNLHWQSAPLLHDFAHRGKRRLFLPARREGAGVVPVKWNGSGDFYSAARADGLVDLQPGGSWKAGEILRFLPYIGHFAGNRGIGSRDETPATNLPQGRC